MADKEERLTRELQAAHDAVLNFDFAEHGETDFERMVELRRRLEVSERCGLAWTPIRGHSVCRIFSRRPVMRLCLVGLDLNVTPLPLGDDTVGRFSGVPAWRFGRWRAFGVEMLREFARARGLPRQNKYRRCHAVNALFRQPTGPRCGTEVRAVRRDGSAW